jgi:hypothetical protein
MSDEKWNSCAGSSILVVRVSSSYHRAFTIGGSGLTYLQIVASTAKAKVAR